jgi:hypothetical protein
MKSCSYCGRENADAAPVCCECRTEFPGPAEDDSALKDPAYSLRVLAEFSTVIEADLLRAQLEAAGIEACIPEELNPQMFWDLVPSVLDAITVRVAAKDYEAAKEFLAALKAAEPPTPPPLPARPPGQPPPLPPWSAN